MYLDKNKKITLISYVALFIAGCLFRWTDSRFTMLYFRPMAFSVLFFCSICIIFIFFAYRNIANKYVQVCLIVVAALLLFRKVDEMLMQNMFPISSVQTRMLWYLQYIPTNFIPNAILMAVLNSWTPHGEKINRRWYYTILVSALLTAAVLTNDYHQLAFRFPAGFAGGLAHFRFGPVYYLCMVWIFVVIMLSYGSAIRASDAGRTRRGAWGVVVFMALGLIYTIWYSTGNRMILRHGNYFSDVDIWIFCFIGTLEYAIRTGLIRSNFNYIQFFEASTLSAQLEDSTGIRFQTENIIPSTEEQRRAALSGEVYLDRDHRLHGREIYGGRIYWVEDIGAVNRVTTRLNETKTRLEQEKDLIRAENQMIVRSVQAEEQNRLYDLLAKRVQPQLDKIEDILSNTSPDDPDFKEKIAEACVYKVFIKRLANMELLAQEDSKLNIFELRSAMRESEEYIKLNNGIQVSSRVTGKGLFRADALMLVYTVCHDVIEDSLDILESIEIRVHGEDGIIGVRMFIAGRGVHERTIIPEKTRKHLYARGAELSVDRGWNTAKVSIENIIGWG